jgi:hypothetical protein
VSSFIYHHFVTGENNVFDDARFPGLADFHPAKNEFHREEQVLIPGIIILMLETNLIGKPENLPSILIIERVGNGRQR